MSAYVYLFFCQITLYLPSLKYIQEQKKNSIPSHKATQFQHKY